MSPKLTCVSNPLFALGLVTLAACGGGGSGAVNGSSGEEPSTGSGASSGNGGSASGQSASGGGSGSASGGSSGGGSVSGGGASGSGVSASGSASSGAGESSGTPAGSGASASGSAGSGHSSGQSLDASASGATSASGADASTQGSPDGSTGNGSSKVLIYGVATAFDHASIPAAAMAIAQAAEGAGLTVEIQPANITTNNNTTPIPADFTPQALSAYGAVVLLASSGEPMGTPGTTQIQALIDFVTAGGGLVAIEDANHAYDNSTANPSTAFVSLIGGDFNGHTGYGAGTCQTVGSQESNAMLPATFSITDEVYYYQDMDTDVQVVLTCNNPGAAPRPVSWVRTQGNGRVFYTGLGHDDHSWTMPPLVSQHILPALLWTMKR